MLNSGPLTYESGALPIALRGPASEESSHLLFDRSMAYSVCHCSSQIIREMLSENLTMENCYFLKPIFYNLFINNLILCCL